MKKLLLMILILLANISYAQQSVSLCVDINDIDPSNGYDIFTTVPGYIPNSLQFESTQCYYTIEDLLFLDNREECCDNYLIPFSFEGGETYILDLQIKCADPKPNCTVIDLSQYENNSTPSGNSKITIPVCESSPITFMTDPAPGAMISWDAGIGTVNQGPSHIAQITWPIEGSYTLTLTVGTSVTTYCIDVLDAPEADFLISGGCGCLNSAVDFMSTGLGGNQFFWDFGDGEYDSGENVSHSYDMAGIYDVTLVVVQDNIDSTGGALCCCTDTITYPVTIEPLEGPNIYWVSTLCEGDTTKYWTDAMDCSYTWDALDSEGLSVLPLGTDITNDTLCVVWGDGPFGTVTLEVDGCSDGPYCTKPTAVVVPIVESNTTISGKDTVCSNTITFYDVPKWPTVTYDWELIPASAGTIISGDGTNAITINWNAGPQSATINVTYASDFLGGIVGHIPADCAGSASYNVDILPEFEIRQPLESQYCVDELFILEAGDIGPTNIDPINGWTWEIIPPAGSTTIISGIMGPYTTSLGSAGNYIIRAYPDFPNPYCNDTLTQNLSIIEVPLADSITGPKEICANETAIYFGYASIPGVSLEWAVTGGSISGAPVGNPLTVDWGSTPPFIVSVKQVQIDAPNCESEYIECSVGLKMMPPVSDILGTNNCANEISSFSAFPAPTHPDATYAWNIIPPEAGSVIAGETTPNCDIQWNDYTGLVDITFTQTLCDIPEDFTKMFTINKAADVTITQSGNYCIGSTTSTLTASTPSAMYDWQTPSGGSAPDAQTISITEAGNYTLTVTESTGCTAVANYTVNEIPGPNTNLTSPDILDLCTSGAGDMVSLHALSGPWAITEWWKQTNAGPFMLQTMPADPLEYIHTNSGVVGTCTYYYVATNTSGCQSISNTITVNQVLCGGGGSGSGCVPENHNVSLSYTPEINCNTVTFEPVVSSNVTITGWDFNDPINITPIYPGPMFTYTTAGYYVAYMYYDVPDVNGGPDCSLFETVSVCVPLVADFSIVNNNCGEYVFTNISSYISGMAPTSFDWNFGDTNTATGMMVSHGYTSPGIYPVQLIITNPDGCVSELTINVEVVADPIADIIVMPSDTCIDKPFIFSNSDDTGVVSWAWDFDDGSTNAASMPTHAYGIDDTYMVTLTVTDEFGCTASDVQSVVVHPAPTVGPITYTDDLLLCENETIILTAPLGDTYEWNTGAMTPTIIVMMGGEYAVTVTDANGCSFVPDPVEVVELPPIDNVITGSNVICDEGCTTLYASTEFGYMYTWTNQLGTVLPPNTPPSSIDICYGNGVAEVNLNIQDDNGCEADNSIMIEYFSSPDVTITPSDPLLCAGMPNVLTASTTYPDPVTYLWNTGAVGSTITVGLEGSYYVTVTDPTTGCSSSDVIIINPLPDLCLVPTGCYNTCDPDTICAPDGLDEYEWYYNGVQQAMWSGLECIIVSESGAYNFEGTNSFGCTDFSDTLYLIMEPCCRLGDTEIDANPTFDGEPCCYSFDYSLAQDIFYSLDLHSVDAGLDIDVTSVSPALSITSSVPSLNSFENATAGNPLPLGPISDFITICLEDVTSSPAYILADWRGENGEVLCTDTLILECGVEPDCIYVLEDTITCKLPNTLVLEMTVCNPVDGDFTIGFIDIEELAPASATIVPSFVDLDPGLAPGDCIDLIFTITGSGIMNDSLKYILIAHENNPAEDPTSLCCASDVYCEFIPGCSLCDMIYVSSVDTSDIGDCCYDIEIYNYSSADIFDGLSICALSPESEFDVVNPMGSPWTLDNLSNTSVDMSHSSGSIPLGSMTLPTICISESTTPYTQIEIKYMQGDDIICRDTIDILCENDCGYLSNFVLECGPTPDTWSFTGSITNTSDFTMSSAFIDFGIGGFTGYNGNIDLGSLAPGDTYGPLNIIIDIPSIDLDELCIITTLHSSEHSDNHEECCSFKTIVDVPDDCGSSTDCECGPGFEDEVLLGINCAATTLPLTFNFSPVGNFNECDQVVWKWISETTANLTTGNESINHTFPAPGEYKICMEITRTASNGKQCKEQYCKEVDVFPGISFETYPNPATSSLFIEVISETYSKMTTLNLIDMNNRLVRSEYLMIDDTKNVEIDVSDLHTGVYTLRIMYDNEVETKRILVVK